jgi:MoxR-like ATPase
MQVLKTTCTLTELSARANLQLAAMSVPQWDANGNRTDDGNPFQPILIKGAPGTAKTQWCKTTFRSLYASHISRTLGDESFDASKLGFIQERVGGRDPVEYCGSALPSRDADGNAYTAFSKPPLITKLWQMVDQGFIYGILLLDELLQVASDGQTILSDLLDPDERTLMGWDIPPGWIIIATGNRTSDRAGARKMLSMLKDRILEAELEFDVRGWLKHGASVGVDPLFLAAAHYYEITKKTEFFSRVVTDETINTLRSYTRAARHFTAFMQSPDYDGIAVPDWVWSHIAGNIGADAATLLRTYCTEIQGRLSPEEIYANPAEVEVSTCPAEQLFAATRACDQATSMAQLEATMIYATRLCDEVQCTVAEAVFAEIGRKQYRGWSTDVAVSFIEKHGDKAIMLRNIKRGL